MKSTEALLVLEDGTVFQGKPFAATGRAFGETVFYTGVVGYQEVITDPSYAGSLLVLTYPIIGSYGVNQEDSESAVAHTRGVVIRECSRRVSNFRATGTLEEFLIDRGVVGIRGIDTRALAVHLREHGEMKGMIASEGSVADELVDLLKRTASPWQSDLVAGLQLPEVPPPAGKKTHQVVALNLGVKNSLLAQLAELGCVVEVLPASAKPDEVLKGKPDGLILAGGPGNPQVFAPTVDTVKRLLGKLPILGVGLGQGLLGAALGCALKRMKTGHHGLNYPVKRPADGFSEITVQHHSFVVDAESVPETVQVTHVNVNDGTVEGIGSREFAAASVQFHPARDEMNRPNRLLVEFVNGL